MIIPDRKKAVTVIIGKGHPDNHLAHGGEVEAPGVANEGMEVLEGIMEDFLNGWRTNSAHAMALAFKAAFAYLESQPHEEGSEE